MKEKIKTALLEMIELDILKDYVQPSDFKKALDILCTDTNATQRLADGTRGRPPKNS